MQTNPVRFANQPAFLHGPSATQNVRAHRHATLYFVSTAILTQQNEEEHIVCMSHVTVRMNWTSCSKYALTRSWLVRALAEHSHKYEIATSLLAGTRVRFQHKTCNCSILAFSHQLIDSPCWLSSVLGPVARREQFPDSTLDYHKASAVHPGYVDPSTRDN